MEKLAIIGNITADAVIRDVNGKHVINFNVAVNKKYTNKDGQKIEKATFYKCAIWRDNTTIAQYIKKGDRIYVEGNPEVETYQNKNGETIANIKINIRGEVVLLGDARKKENETTESAPSQEASHEAENVLVPNAGGNDDLPF